MDAVFWTHSDRRIKAFHLGTGLAPKIFHLKYTCKIRGVIVRWNIMHLSGNMSSSGKEK